MIDIRSFARIASHRRTITVGLSLLVVSSLAFAGRSEEPIPIAEVEQGEPVDFSRQILPILRSKCLACHNKSDAESDLALETPELILQGGYSGPAAVAGDSDASPLLQLAAKREEPTMPPEENEVGAEPLTSHELGLLKLWIEQGAQGGAGDSQERLQWQSLPPGMNPIYAVAVSPDGQFAAAGRANQVSVYHLPSQRFLGRLTDPELIDGQIYTRPGVAHLDMVQSLRFSPDGQTLASGGYRTVKLWRRTDQHPGRMLATVSKPTSAVATSGTNPMMAVGQENGDIRLLDLVTGTQTKRLTGRSAPVRAVSFSTDGVRLASASDDKTVRVWNIAKGMPVAEIPTSSPVHSICWLESDKFLVTGHADSIIRVWETAAVLASSSNAEQAAEQSGGPKPSQSLKGHSGPIAALAAVTPQSGRLLSGSEDGTVRLWELASGRQLRQMNHGGPVVDVGVRPDGTRFASASTNGTAQLWDAANGKQVAELTGDFRARINVEDRTRAVAIAKKIVEGTKDDLKSAKERQTAEDKNAQAAEDARKKAADELAAKTAAEKKTRQDKAAVEAALAEARAALEKAKKEDKPKAEQEIKVKEDELKKLADLVDKAGKARAAAEKALQSAEVTGERAKKAAERVAKAIPEVEAQVAAAEQQVQQSEAKLQEAKTQEAALIKPLHTVEFAPDGHTIATAGDTGAVYTWDAETGVPIATLTGHESPLLFVAFASTDEIVSLPRHGNVLTWGACPTWEFASQIGRVDDPIPLVDRVTALDFSSDGTLLATGGGEPSRNGELKIWDVREGKLLQEMPDAHSDTVLGVAFSPHGSRVASCGADRFAKIFTLETGELIRALEGHTHHVLDISWRADSRLLATAGADNVIKVWNPATGEQVRTITGFGKQVTAVRFLGETDHIIASCGDHSLHMKRVGDGRNVRSFGGASDYLHGAATSANGQIIAAGGQDSVLRIWRQDGQSVAAFEP
jgi:WD40 repeat protein